MDNEEDVRGIIVSPSTGEEIGYLCSGDRVVKKASVEYLNNSQEWKIENFFKGHVGEINKWINELSTSEKAFYFQLCLM